MHEGREKATRARSTLAACGIEVGTDFRALSTSQIDALLAYAEQHRLNKYGPTSKYRMPLSPDLLEATSPTSVRLKRPMTLSLTLAKN
jgi:hypothetical protein